MTAAALLERWWINGAETRQVDVADRGLAYGDGLFETLAVRDGAPRFLELHLDRLLTGCERLGLPVPDRRGLATELRTRAAQVPHGALKLILTRGPGPRGYRPPADCRPTRAMGLFASLPVAGGEGIRLRFCTTPASRSPATAGLKTLNRLEQVLARREWTDPDIAEGLMADETGSIVGGTMSNVFLAQPGVLLTPALDHGGVRGVMRRVVLAAAARLGMVTAERTVSREELLRAEEIFLSNALWGIRPVVALEGRTLAVGGTTARLAGALRAEFGVGEWES